METSAEIRASYALAPDRRLVPGADLTAVDLLGADLRDAQSQGADLERALFLTQQQVNAARKDPATRLPAALAQPSTSAVSASR